MTIDEFLLRGQIHETLRQEALGDLQHYADLVRIFPGTDHWASPIRTSVLFGVFEPKDSKAEATNPHGIVY